MVFEFFAANPGETQMIIKLFISAVLGGVIGIERERYRRPAGLRTHMLVAMGAAVFTLLSVYAFPPNADPGRGAAYVIVGIGFIGAGTVIQIRDKVSGLTTASSLWLTASIGMSVALGYYLLATSTTVLGFIVLCMKHVEKTIVKSKPIRKR